MDVNNDSGKVPYSISLSSGIHKLVPVTTSKPLTLVKSSFPVSSSFGNNVIFTENEHFSSNSQNKKSVSPAYKSRESKLPAKKSRAKSTRNKHHGSPILAIDDEDDDNDFIPVGTLQLPTVRVVTGTETQTKSTTVSTDAQSHLTQGHVIKCEDPALLRDYQNNYVPQSVSEESKKSLQGDLKQLLDKQLKHHHQITQDYLKDANQDKFGSPVNERGFSGHGSSIVSADPSNLIKLESVEGSFQEHLSPNMHKVAQQSNVEKLLLYSDIKHANQPSSEQMQMVSEVNNLPHPMPNAIRLQHLAHIPGPAQVSSHHPCIRANKQQADASRQSGSQNQVVSSVETAKISSSESPNLFSTSLSYFSNPKHSFSSHFPNPKPSSNPHWNSQPSSSPQATVAELTSTIQCSTFSRQQLENPTQPFPCHKINIYESQPYTKQSTPVHLATRHRHTDDAKVASIENVCLPSGDAESSTLWQRQQQLASMSQLPTSEAQNNNSACSTNPHSSNYCDHQAKSIQFKQNVNSSSPYQTCNHHDQINFKSLISDVPQTSSSGQCPVASFPNNTTITNLRNLTNTTRTPHNPVPSQNSKLEISSLANCTNSLDHVHLPKAGDSNKCKDQHKQIQPEIEHNDMVNCGTLQKLGTSEAHLNKKLPDESTDYQFHVDGPEKKVETQKSFSKEILTFSSSVLLTSDIKLPDISVLAEKENILCTSSVTFEEGDRMKADISEFTNTSGNVLDNLGSRSEADTGIIYATLHLKKDDASLSEHIEDGMINQDTLNSTCQDGTSNGPGKNENSKDSAQVNSDEPCILSVVVKNSEIQTGTHIEVQSINVLTPNSSERIEDTLVSKGEILTRELRQRKPKNHEDLPLKHRLRTLTVNLKKLQAITNASIRRSMPAPVQNLIDDRELAKIPQNRLMKHKEMTELNDAKQNPKQIDLSIDGKGSKNKDKKHYEDDVEGTNSEIPTLSRRLSSRLQVKGKAKLEDMQKTPDNIRTQVVMHSHVDSTPASLDANISTRSSRQTDLSATSNAKLIKTPSGMATRSKDIRTTAKSQTINRKRNSKFPGTNNTFTSSRVNVPTRSELLNKDNTLTNPVKSESLRQGFMSRNLMRLKNACTLTNKSKNAPSLTSRRITARQAVASLHKLRSQKQNKIKRTSPNEFVDKLPQWRKNVKKQNIPRTLITPTEHLNEKEIHAKQDTPNVNSQNVTEPKIEEISKSEIEKTPLRSRKRKKKRNKKNNDRLKIMLTSVKRNINMEITTDKNKINDAKSNMGNINNLQERVEESCKEGEKRHTVKVNINNDITAAEQKDLPNEEIEATHGEKIGLSVLEDLANVKLQQDSEVLTNQTLTIPSASCVGLKAKVKEFVLSSSTSTENNLLPEDQSDDQALIIKKRPKMVMFKLVPVLDNDFSSQEVSESLVPISGYFVLGGDNDCILLPEDSLPELMASRISSTAAATCTSLLLSAEKSEPQNFEVEHRLPHILKTTVEPSYELKKSWNFKSDTSTVSPAADPSSWAHNMSNSPPTPPPSVGEPSVVVPKKLSTTEVLQASPSQYRPSPSWTTTPPSSSPLPSMASSPAWNLSSFTHLPPPPPPYSHHLSQQPNHLLTTSSQGPSFQLSPSITSPLSESWTKDCYSSSASSRIINSEINQGASMVVGPSTYIDSPAKNIPVNPEYSMTADPSHYLGYTSSQDHFLESASADHLMDSSELYNDSLIEDPEFLGNRDQIIQGFLRHMSSNVGGYSQELAGLKLNQEDIAYLENRLRQDLSPSVLLAAMSAYDNIREDGGMEVSYESSLQDGLSLVHTVNLDVDEAEFNSPTNHPDSEFGILATSSAYTPTSGVLESTQLNNDYRGGSPVPPLSGSHVSENWAKSPQKDGPEDMEEEKIDGRKRARERKSQYEIVMENNIKKFKCLICGKCLGVATIYRHLRIHDPDYKVWCNICGKMYTQRHGVNTHWKKYHAPQVLSATLEKDIPVETQDEQPEIISTEMKSTDLETLNVSIRSVDTSVGVTDIPQISSDVSVKASDVISKSDQLPQNMSDPHYQSEYQISERLITHATNDLSVTGLDESKQDELQATSRQTEEVIEMNTKRIFSTETYPSSYREYDNGNLYKGSLKPDMNKNTENQLKNNATTMESDVVTTTSLDALISKTTCYQASSGSNNQLPIYLADTSEAANMLQEKSVSSLIVSRENQSFSHLDAPKPKISTQPVGDNFPELVSLFVSNSCQSLGEPQKESALSEDESQTTSGTILPSGDMFVCEICNTHLCSRNGYVMHKRRHSEIKTKFCTYCKKGFHTGQEVRSHERIHTGERPFKCPTCYTTFAHSGSFVAHKKSHVKRGELQPFPVVDGVVQYPSTFKKPRIEGETSSPENLQRIKKKKKKKLPSVLGNTGEQNVYQTGFLLDYRLDNNEKMLESTNKDNNKGRDIQDLHNTEPRPNLSSFSTNMEYTALKDHSGFSSNVGVATSHNGESYVKDRREYVPCRNSLISPGSVSEYNSAVSYSDNEFQRTFLLPQADSALPEQDPWQDKQTRFSGIAYHTSNQNQVPFSVEKSHYNEGGSSHHISEAAHSPSSYYSSHKLPFGTSDNLPHPQHGAVEINYSHGDESSFAQ